MASGAADAGDRAPADAYVADKAPMMVAACMAGMIAVGCGGAAGSVSPDAGMIADAGSASMDTGSADAGSVTIMDTGIADTSTPADAAISGGCSPGATCNPGGNLCHLGSIACTSSGAVCVDDGSVPDGKSCGDGRVCKLGACVDNCTAGATCTIASAPCHKAVISCPSGACMDTGATLPDDTSCGSGKVCKAGACGASTPAEPPPVPVEVYGGNKYLFVLKRDTQANAQDYCKRYGYNLVTVDDADENAWLTSRINTLTRPETCWTIGLVPNPSGAGWVWIDGSASTYRNWGPGEPNGGNGPSSCVCIARSIGLPSGAWNDAPCSVALPFVCKMRP